MQSELALNVQQSIRPGHCVDTFYYGKENSMKQCHATVLDNRFFTALGSGAQTSGSSATLTLNPAQGVSEVILIFQLPATTPGGDNTYTGVGAPQGWAYSLVKRIGYRYSSSSLYYVSGGQSLMQAVSMVEDSGKRDQLIQLGGSALLGGATPSAGNRTGYVYLRLPHSSPAVAGGALPFPSDTITSPIQIQIDLADFNSVFSLNPTGGTGSLPTSVNCQANFSQVTMQDSADLLARRFNMSENALALPLVGSWTQEAVRINIPAASAQNFQVALTGVKAGDLKRVRLYFTKDSEASPTAGLVLPNKWIAPNDVTFAINGLVYLDSRNGSWQLNNLLRRRVPNFYNYTVLVPGAAGAFSTAAANSTYVEIDLAQPYVEGTTGDVALVHGVAVMNSVLTLSGSMPDASDYTLFVEYDLNASWLITRGGADYVF